MNVAHGRARLADFIGLACYCAMLRPPFLGSLATASLPDPHAMRMAFDLTIIVAGTLLIAAPTIQQKLEGKRVGTLLSLSCLIPLSVVAVCLLRSMGVQMGWLYNVCFIVLGIGFSALTICWFARLTSLPRHLVEAFLLGSFVASHLLGIIDVLPRDTAALVSALYPAASLCLLAWQWHAHKAFSPGGDGTSDVDPGKPAKRVDGALPGPSFMPDESTKGFAAFKRLRLLAIAVIFTEVLCGTFLRCMYSSGGINYSPASSMENTLATYIISAAIGIVLLLIAHATKTAAECTLAVGGTGLIVFTIIAVLVNVVELSWLIPFITGIYSALLVFMMALILLWRLDGDRAIALCAGSFIALFGAASSITATLVPTLLSYNGRMPSEYLVPMGTFAGLIVVLGFGIALASIVVLQREVFLEATAAEDAGAHAAHVVSAPLETESPQPQSLPAKSGGTATSNGESAHEQAMDLLAERFGLTERERETASLVAKGYTAKRVAESMTVALSTVQGYSKSVYRKMDIHRKDELIEAVNSLEQSLR